MNRTSKLLLAGSLVGTLVLPIVSFADDDGPLDRDIHEDRAKIHAEERDLQQDQRRLREEEREGDVGEANAIRRDMKKDERALRRDQRDVHRDLHARRHEEREHDDD